MGDLCKLIWCAWAGLFRSRASLEAEVLVPRHQLNELRRRVSPDWWRRGVKTTVAISVAHALLDGFNGAAFFVNLVSLTDDRLVPTTVARALGLMVQTQDPLRSLPAFIGDKRILLVLDNCEHVIDSAAMVAERVVGETPQAHVLTTRREALRAEGEHVHLLHALDCPPENAGFPHGMMTIHAHVINADLLAFIKE
jgi:hypothetical protein